MEHNNIKQYIILRRDAKTVTGEPVSAHKLAVMTSHASMAFIASMMRANHIEINGKHHIEFEMDDELYDGWLNNSFTKLFGNNLSLIALANIIILLVIVIIIKVLMD